MQSTAASSSTGSSAGVVLVLGTGGTIAGVASDPQRASSYDAAQLGVQQLVAAVPALADVPLRAEQVAQIDSKDMGPAIWWALAQRVSAALIDPAVRGVVITHGTDTLEETSYLLSRIFAADHKPVVLTAAMRPANAPDADGPQNLLDAVTLAGHAGASGVMVVMQGRVWAGAQVRKLHTQAIDAFGTASASPLGWVQRGLVRMQAPWPALGGGQRALGVSVLTADWPRVEVVVSHAGADGRVVDLLVADGVQGLVVAGTGNGSVHQALEAALRRAEAAGVRIQRASRVGQGAVTSRGPARWWPAGDLSPAQARVALMLALMAQAAR